MNQLCYLDQSNLNLTLKNFQSLKDIGGCPHIGVDGSKIHKVTIVSILDSNCRKHDNLSDHHCNKIDSDLFVLIAVRSFNDRERSKFFIYPTIKSLNAEYLEFLDGVVDGHTSTVDLKGKPLCVAPVYRKIAPDNDPVRLRVVKNLAFEQRHVKVEVNAAIKEPVSGVEESLTLFLDITIPARDLLNHTVTSLTTNEQRLIALGENKMDPYLQQAVYEGIKLLVKDGYTYIKGVFTAEEKAPVENALIVSDQSNTKLSELVPESLSNILVKISDNEQTIIAKSIISKIKQYNKLSQNINYCDESIARTPEGPKRVELRSMRDDYDEDIQVIRKELGLLLQPILSNQLEIKTSKE